MSHPEPASSSIAGCLIRLFWMMGGVILLVIFSFTIPEQQFPSIYDAGFWLLVLALIVTRYVDIRYLHGQTAEGNPATLADWGRYALWLVPIALCVWLALHGLGLFIGK